MDARGGQLKHRLFPGDVAYPRSRRSFSRRVGLALLALALGTAGCSIPRWPVDAPLTSTYGFRMRGWTPDLHEGVDLGAPAGTPVQAMKDGRVLFAGTMSGYGQVVILEHGSKLRTVYAHLSRVNVRAGERVRGRQEVGAVGSSGNATGAHLHFEVWRWGRSADPVPLLGGPPGAHRR